MTHKLENNYTKEVFGLLTAHLLGPTTDFPTWGSGKGTENPQGIWLWRPVGFDYRTYTGLGIETFGGQKENFIHRNPGERSNDPTRDWPRLACECPGDSSRGMGQQWPAAGQEHWQQQSWEAQSASISPFGGGYHYPYHGLPSRPNYREGTQSHPSA